jgi:hypothetical protein
VLDLKGENYAVTARARRARGQTKAMTVYLAIPPDSLRACLGFVRGLIGLALDGVTATPARSAQRVASSSMNSASSGAWIAWRTV